MRINRINLGRDNVLGILAGTLLITGIWLMLNSADKVQQEECDFKSACSIMPEIIQGSDLGVSHIRLALLQIEAVSIDMARSFELFGDDTDFLKKASDKAVRDLREIIIYLENPYISEDLRRLKIKTVYVAERLIDIYGKSSTLEPVKIEFELSELRNDFHQVDHKLMTAIKQETMPEVFKSSDFSKDRIKSNQTAVPKDYIQAVELIEDRDYRQAYGILNELIVIHKGTELEYCLLYQLAKCMILSQPGDIPFDLEAGIAILSDIIDSGQYSPVLFEVFQMWRSHTQMFWYGLSNFSEIPNLKYNLKRWKAVETIEKHISDSEDLWAKYQLALLLKYPNIGTGGKYGNDVLQQLNWH